MCLGTYFFFNVNVFTILSLYNAKVMKYNCCRGEKNEKIIKYDVCNFIYICINRMSK
jgi:hypothetical protein